MNIREALRVVLTLAKSGRALQEIVLQDDSKRADRIAEQDAALEKVQGLHDALELFQQEEGGPQE